VTGLRADYAFAEPSWALEARFASKPETDLILTASPEGDVKATRYFLEQDGEHFLMIRFTYPLALRPDAAGGLYEKSLAELMRSRPGKVMEEQPFTLGAYQGGRVIIAQPKERSVRELRLLVVGSSLYVLSAEWPARGGDGAAQAAAFFDSIKLRPDYEDARAVNARERWREVSAGHFRLRYDASRWYRDPSDQDPGIYNFLRTDKGAEAQLIVEDRPMEGGDIAAAVLKTARDGADSVMVKRQGTKLRGAVSLVELEFTATVDGATYYNHGYFFTGPEGTVQLRSWAKDTGYPGVADDITELLDGLSVSGMGKK
jgi:hypothetical protein